MITTELPVTLTLPGNKAPRSKGVHVSSIIRCIAVEAKILTIEDREDLSLIDGSQEDWWAQLDEVARIRICIGLAWEQWYASQLPEVVDHPGEMEVSNIYMTHDGESVSVLRGPRHPKQALIVHEHKATYKSFNRVSDLHSQFMWMSQIKAYARALNTLHARLHVLFLCGDYTWPIRPQLRCWELEFTQQELDDNWELLCAYRDERL